MKIKIKNYSNKKVILRERKCVEYTIITLGWDETYEKAGVHNVHVSAGSHSLTVNYNSRYERQADSCIYIPYDAYIDITIER